MIELLLIYGAVFGFFGVIGLIEKIPVIDKKLIKSAEKLQK